MTELASRFRSELNDIRAQLCAVPSEWADEPWRAGGWTRKQILGHLLDSATNNRQRFVRAVIDGSYEGPVYAQEDWVKVHGYAEQSWVTLLEWWDVENGILTAIVDRIPEDKLDARCVVGEDEAVTLHYLIEDYLRHQYWHLSQILGEDPKQ